MNTKNYAQSENVELELGILITMSNNVIIFM